MALMVMLVLTVNAQSSIRDTLITTVDIGYSNGNLNTVAGAVNKVTE